MTGDEPKRALSEAEGWLVSAKHTLVEAQSEEVLSNVCCAEAILGIIRANDALTLKFFGNKATKHDDAASLFAKLVRERKIRREDERFGELIAKAMWDKSGATYGKGKAFSHEEAREYVEKAGEFIAAAKEYIG
ncbi:MAG: hypothetical protein NTY90_00540 [Candidatus Micrarchaeota archaeon]|nr:hypothetical protein [Candidatus Micrarchaeota archaeon]